MRAVIEKEIALIMHETLLLMLKYIIVRQIRLIWQHLLIKLQRSVSRLRDHQGA